MNTSTMPRLFAALILIFVANFTLVQATSVNYVDSFNSIVGWGGDVSPESEHNDNDPLGVPFVKSLSLNLELRRFIRLPNAVSLKAVFLAYTNQRAPPQSQVALRQGLNNS